MEILKRDLCRPGLAANHLTVGRQEQRSSRIGGIRWRDWARRMKYPQFEAREFIATGGRVVMLFSNCLVSKQLASEVDNFMCTF